MRPESNCETSYFRSMSLIYNVTVKVVNEKKEEWLDWMLTEHIPEVMATACFRSFRLLHLEGYDDEEGITYAIQYTCPNQELLEIYMKEHAPELQKKHMQKFEGHFVAFRTILKLLAEG